MQIVNFFNAKKLNDELNILEGFLINFYQSFQEFVIITYFLSLSSV